MADGFAFLYDFGLESAVPVSWRLFFDGTVFALHGLAHLAVSPVLAAVALVLGEMLLILDLIIFQKFQKIRFLEGVYQALNICVGQLFCGEPVL